MLSSQTLCALKKYVSQGPRGVGINLTLNVAYHATEYGSLSTQYALQASQLFGVGITACAAAQRETFFEGKLDQLAPCDLKQSTVRRIRNRFLLYCAINDYATEIFDGDYPHRLSRFDGLSQAFFPSPLRLTSGVSGRRNSDHRATEFGNTPRR